MGLARYHLDRRRLGLVLPWTAKPVLRRRTFRQFKHLRNIQTDCPNLIIRVPKRKGAFARRPGSPAIDLILGRIAADPVRVHQHVRIGPCPIGCLRQCIPCLWFHDTGVRVHFLQTQSRTEIRLDLVNDVLGFKSPHSLINTVTVRTQTGKIKRQAMDHVRGQREQWPPYQPIVISGTVAVRQPPLSRRTFAPIFKFRAISTDIRTLVPNAIGPAQ